MRRLQDSRKVKVLPNVNRRAVSTVESPVAWIGVHGARKFSGHQVADTMRPSVVREHGEVIREPVFRRYNQRVVAGSAAVVQVFKVSIKRPLARIQLS